MYNPKMFFKSLELKMYSLGANYAVLDSLVKQMKERGVILQGEFEAYEESVSWLSKAFVVLRKDLEEVEKECTSMIDSIEQGLKNK